MLAHLVAYHDMGHFVFRSHRQDVISRFTLGFSDEKTAVLPLLEHNFFGFLPGEVAMEPSKRQTENTKLDWTGTPQTHRSVVGSAQWTGNLSSIASPFLSRN